MSLLFLNFVKQDIINLLQSETHFMLTYLANVQGKFSKAAEICNIRLNFRKQQWRRRLSILRKPCRTNKKFFVCTKELCANATIGFIPKRKRFWVFFLVSKIYKVDFLDWKLVFINALCDKGSTCTKTNRTREKRKSFCWTELKNCGKNGIFNH